MELQCKNSAELYCVTAVSSTLIYPTIVYVHFSVGRPIGTTRDAGSNVGTGRPIGTTRDAGSNVGTGRPISNTRDAGSNVSDGRPMGTSREEGGGTSSTRSLCVACFSDLSSVMLFFRWFSYL